MDYGLCGILVKNILMLDLFQLLLDLFQLLSSQDVN